IEVMHKPAIATAILSGIAGFDADTEPKADTVRRARLTNEYGAKLVADHKGRFGLFAVLPLPHIDESLKEIEDALDTLKTDGVFLWTNYGDHWRGERASRKVCGDGNRRKAVVYTHPVKAPCCNGLQPETPGFFSVELATNTSRAIRSLISEGSSGKPTTSAATRYSDV